MANILHKLMRRKRNVRELFEARIRLESQRLVDEGVLDQEDRDQLCDYVEDLIAGANAADERGLNTPAPGF